MKNTHITFQKENFMKKIACILACFLLVSCSSSNKTSATSSNTVPPPDEHQVIIDRDYPKVAYADVAGLKTLAEFPVGMEVQAGDETRSLFEVVDQQPLLRKHFSEVVPGNIMKISFLHPEENVFTFDDADRLVDFALANDMTVHGHTLIWWHPEQIPAWMKNYTGDWNAMMHDHVYQIVSHFRGLVHSWDVVNEAVSVTNISPTGKATGATYYDSIFYQKMGKEFIENAFKSARQADPDALLYYNDWALSHNDAKLDFTLAMVNDFLARSIPIDGIGFQMHTWLDWPSVSDIKTAFAKAAATGLMVKITEMDMRINNSFLAPPQGFRPKPQLTPELALAQKDRYKAIVAAYLDAVPPAQRGGITFWGLIDGETWMQHVLPYPEWPLLLHDDYTVKPAFYGVAEALTQQ